MCLTIFTNPFSFSMFVFFYCSAALRHEVQYYILTSPQFNKHYICSVMFYINTFHHLTHTHTHMHNKAQRERFQNCSFRYENLDVHALMKAHRNVSKERLWLKRGPEFSVQLKRRPDRHDTLQGPFKGLTLYTPGWTGALFHFLSHSRFHLQHLADAFLQSDLHDSIQSERSRVKGFELTSFGLLVSYANPLAYSLTLVQRQMHHNPTRI